MFLGSFVIVLIWFHCCWCAENRTILECSVFTFAGQDTGDLLMLFLEHFPSFNVAHCCWVFVIRYLIRCRRVIPTQRKLFTNSIWRSFSFFTSSVRLTQSIVSKPWRLYVCSMVYLRMKMNGEIMKMKRFFVIAWTSRRVRESMMGLTRIADIWI